MCKEVQKGSTYSRWRKIRELKYLSFIKERNNDSKDIRPYLSDKKPLAIDVNAIVLNLENNMGMDRYYSPLIISRNDSNLDGARIRSYDEKLILPSTGIYTIEPAVQDDESALVLSGSILSLFSILLIITAL